MIKRITVYCTLCDWKAETTDLQEWHDRLCPTCSQEVIVTDEELTAWRMIRIFDEIYSRIAECNPEADIKGLVIDLQHIRMGKGLEIQVVV